MTERVRLDDFNSIPSRAALTPAAEAPPWRSTPWGKFRDESAAEPAWLVSGLLPEGSLVFVAAPPKRGKTWLALGLGLSVATRCDLFGEFTIPEPRTVLYVALEGARSAIRARIGALARGLGIDPGGEGLERLHVLYRPRPFDLAKPELADMLCREAAELGAALVVVDVLRSAARFKENAADEFALVRDGLEPLLGAGCTVALLHHFGKLTEAQKERTPGERMAGTGAMHGALDVGFFITKSESGARRLRVEIEARDFATPEALGVVILGSGSGEHGGFTFGDVATFALDASAAEDRDLVAELEELFARDGVWRTVKEAAGKEKGVGANPDDVRATFDRSPERFAQVEGPRAGRHVTARPWGTVAMLRQLEQAEQVTQGVESPESPALTSTLSAGGGAGDSPYGGRSPSHLLADTAAADSASESPEPAPSASSRPLIGDEGYLERMYAALLAGLITEGEWHEADRAHRFVVAAERASS